MDGIHDLGGRQGFGPVEVEPHEPVFHEPWEPLARALVTAVWMGLPDFSTAGLRHAVERIDPAAYLTQSYYEHWLTAAASMAVDGGLVTVEELEERAGGSFPLCRPVRSDAAGELPGDPPAGRSRFGVGDRVRVREWHPFGHTRCPGYVMGKVGVVTRRDGAFNVPDLEAHTPHRIPEATYSVRFDADELWHDGQAGVGVHVDLWDSYLEVP